MDVVADIHIQQATSLLKDLTGKLYKMNPLELKKNPGQTIKSRIESIFQCPFQGKDAHLDSKSGVEAILAGFETDFHGDRVFAMMYGLYTMLIQSYSGKCELYLVDVLDQQSLYNSARNIEIFVWRIKNRKRVDGRLFLETNQTKGPVENLSFERIFGKLVSLQDTMALIVSSKSGRMITRAVHTAATMAFLPVGI